MLLSCCNQPGFLRTSSRGLAHFVHHTKSDNCTSQPETWQHLKAKSQIARACREAGWEAITEASGEGWRADILAIRGKAKVAFEVQWSPQTLEETEVRQQRYAEAGVRCCWLFKAPPRCFQARSDIALFKINITDEESQVIFNPYEYDRSSYKEDYNQNFELQTFVQFLLGDKIKFSPTLVALRQQEVSIQFIEIKCWKCAKPYDIYYTSPLVSACNKAPHKDFDLNPQVISAALKFAQSPEGQHIQIGAIKKRYSKTIRDNFMSFECPHCDTPCHPFFFEQKVMVYRDEYPIRAVHKFRIDLQEPISISQPHWCYSEKGQFCSEQFPIKA